MYWSIEEIQEIVQMVYSNHLDVRTVTMGISLHDCVAHSVPELCRRVRNKIHRCAKDLVKVARSVEDDFGIPIVNKRVSVTPIALVAAAAGPEALMPLARTLDRVAKELEIDYLAGFSALVQKGSTPGDSALLRAIPQVLSETDRVCSSVNVASTKAGINMDAVLQMADVILETARRTADRDAIGCCKLVVFANAAEDNPFIAGGMVGVGEPDCVINVGVSGPGVVLKAIQEMRASGRKVDLGTLAEVVKRTAFKVTRAGEWAGREVARRLGNGVAFGIVDLSLAPTPAVGDSVANILEAMGIERTGAPGTTAALFLLTDAVKKGGVMASSYVGGLSGAFIPVSEDQGMIDAVDAGALTLEKLEAMTSICSVGLDMVAIPGDTPVETIAAIIADEAAIGVMNNKTTAVRIIPVPGKTVGDRAVFGGLLGEAPIMAVNTFSAREFVRAGGRIPAPVQSLRN